MHTIVDYQTIPDIPISLTNHISEEYSFNLIEKEYFGNCFKHLVNWIFVTNMTTTCNTM